MRKLIYLEDHQMYYTVPIVFETNAELTIEEMQKISYEPIGAGRHSTSFETFKKLMEQRGYIINKISILKEDSAPEYIALKIIKGATGNY